MDKHIIPGVKVNQRDMDWGQWVKGMMATDPYGKPLAQMPSLSTLKTKKPRKPSAKRTVPNNRDEDRLRPLIAKELRRLGWEVRRVEPCFRGKFGLGDYWVMHEYRKLAGWVEVKTLTGGLSADQQEIQRLCWICGVKYWIIRRVEDVKNIC